MRLRLFCVAVLAALVAALPWAGVAGAHTGPDHSQQDPVDGPVDDHDHKQHGEDGGHLPASSKNVELVGKVELTTNPSGIADVAAFGDYAYLNAFSSECTGRGGNGTGVHVVDISNPAAPQKVNFLQAEDNSYVGEGVHVIELRGRRLLLHNNETCDSSLPVVSGFAVWDVTNPVAAVKLAQFGDALPAMANQTYHTTHSVQGFVWRDRAYAVAQDNQDLADVDIFDITPVLSGGMPVLVAERGLEDWPAAHGSYANGDSVFHHDMQQKVIDGHNYLMVSYWDAGQVLLNIDDPANPVYVTDSNYSSPDPQMPAFEIPEGNSHQSYWSSDGRYLLSSDEDFSATRTLCTIKTGPGTGATGCGEFGWTVPISTNFPSGFDGASAVFGGSGCEEDVNGNGTSDRAEVPSAASTGADLVVFGRGTCFFSTKVESGQLAGYEMVAIANSHGGSRNGLLPDAFICGSQGHAFTVTASAICIGHRAMHELFSDAAAFTGPDLGPGGDLPAIGTLGSGMTARGGVFDGWGYVHLHDATQPGLPVIDTYGVAEAFDPAYADGFGNLTVHEVKTDPRRNKNLAYFSYYDAGLRVASFGPGGITEVGHYIAEGGNDFWGVYPHCVGPCLLNDRDSGRGAHNAKRPLLLMSDRDSGLWIFRYTGKE